jgi:F-type H+-transporting ATPase subunit h
MRPVTRVAQFHASTVSRADLIQDMYIRELKNYKSSPPDPKEAAQTTKHWQPPAPPVAPKIETSIDQDLQAYRDEPVDLDTSASESETQEEKPEEDWLVIEDPEDEKH